MEILDRAHRGHGPVLIDGGMASEMQRRGAPMDRVAWSARALIDAPEIVRAAHESYIRAGADVIITNTFSTAPHVLRLADLGSRAAELNARAVELAQEARAATGRRVAVAGSMSASMGSSGAPAPPLDELASSYAQLASRLAESGVDLLALEMMIDPEVTEVALAAAHAVGLPVWLGVSCQVEPSSREVRMFGQRSDLPLAAFLERVLPAGFDALLVMHSEVGHIPAALDVARRYWDGPLGAYAHRGRFESPDWVFEDTITPEEYAERASSWILHGARLIGGCCGIGPEHIAALDRALAHRFV